MHLSKKDQKQVLNKPIGKTPIPSQIKERLDEYIIGQDTAKRHLPLQCTITISV